MRRPHLALALAAAGCAVPDALDDADPIAARVLDTEAPLVRIASPADGDRVRDRVVVNVDVTEDNLEHVMLWVDQHLAGSRTEPPFEFWLNDLTAGAHAVTAIAQDVAAHRTSHSLTIWAYPEVRPSPGSDPHEREPSPVITGGCATSSSAPPLSLMLLGALAWRRRHA
jgi:uncharacterized protein (TIGR03382 family)